MIKFRLTYFLAALLAIGFSSMTFAQDGGGGAAPSAPAYDFTTEGYGSVFIENYPLGPGDELSIKIFTLETIEYPVKVSQDGKLVIPFIGELDVAGWTIPKLREEITNQYKEYYVDFTVSVDLINVKRIQVYVFGNVINPGIYTVFANTTLMEFLQKIGLSTSGQNRRLIHHRADVETVIDPYKFTVFGEIEQNNIYLQFGDKIEVDIPELSIAITGKVNRPGVYEVLPGETMKEILLLAGGPDPFADIHEAVVERYLPDGSLQRIRVDLNKIISGEEQFVFLNRDRLNVPVREYFIYILGAVAVPGKYPFEEGRTIEQYIADAGGFDKDAHLSFVTLIRPGPRYGNQVAAKYTINLKDVLTEKFEADSNKGAFSRTRVPLEPGDVIMVPYKGSDEKYRNMGLFFDYVQNVLQSILVFKK
jgi:protein involved in polysaccharide export with SLBB domain